MEHRCCPRVAGALSIALSHVHGRVGIFRTRNLSLDGLFLETGAVDLRLNEPVVLRLDPDTANHRMRGFVVHRSSQGIGVMLTERDPTYAEIVLDLMERDGQASDRATAVARAASRPR